MVNFEKTSVFNAVEIKIGRFSNIPQEYLWEMESEEFSLYAKEYDEWVEIQEKNMREYLDAYGRDFYYLMAGPAGNPDNLSERWCFAPDLGQGFFANLYGGLQISLNSEGKCSLSL
jgi:hypothetical protein